MSQPNRDAADYNRSAARALDSVARGKSATPLTLEHPLVFFPLAGIVIGVVAVAVFWNSFASGMTLDNKYIIEAYFQTFLADDPKYDFSTWKHVGLIFSQDYWWPKGISGLYRPVATFSYWLNYLAVEGAVDWKTQFPLQRHVFGFHLVNLVLHWTVGLLVCVLARRMTGRRWLSLLCGAMFVAHPVTTESVTNIIGRADLFAGAAVVGGLLIYIRSTESVGWRRLGWLAALLPVALVGLFAKESAAAIGLVVFAYDFVYRFDRQSLREAGWKPHAVAGIRLALIGTMFWAFASYALKVVTPWLSKLDPGTLQVAGVAFLIAATVALFSATIVLGRSKPYAAIVLLAFVHLVADVALLVCGHSPAGWFVALATLFLIAFEISNLKWGLFFVVPHAPTASDVAAAPGAGPARVGFYDGYYVLLAAAVTMFAVRSWVFYNATPPEEPFVDNPIRGVNWLDGRLTAVKVLGKNLLLLSFPKTLTADYSYNEVPVFTWDFTRFENWKPLFAMASVVALLGVAAWNYRRNKPVCFFILFFFVTILPTSNIPITIGAIMAERFLYVPLAAFVVLFAIGVDRGVRWIVSGDAMGASDVTRIARVSVGVTLSVAIVLLGVRAILRNQDWRDDEALWAAAYRTSPNSFRTYQSYAFALYEKDPAGNVDEMIRVANQGKQVLDPLPRKLNSSRLYLHLGMYYNIKGETLLRPGAGGNVTIPPEATAAFSKAVAALEQAAAVDRAFNEVYHDREIRRGKLKPEHIPDAGLAPIYQFLAQSYTRVGDKSRSLQASIYWRHLDPGSVDAYTNVAQQYLNLGRDDSALTALLQTILMGGNQPQYWPVLQQLFSRVGPDGTAAVVVDRQSGKASLDLGRTSVRETLVLAVRDLIRIQLRAKQFDRARAWHDAAVSQYKLPPERIESVFDEKPTPVAPPEPIFPLPPDPSTLPR